MCKKGIALKRLKEIKIIFIIKTKDNGGQTEETVDSTPETTPVEPEPKPEESQSVEESKSTDSTTTQTPQKPTETPTNQPNVSTQSGVSTNTETSMSMAIQKCRFLAHK